MGRVFDSQAAGQISTHVVLKPQTLSLGSKTNVQAGRGPPEAPGRGPLLPSNWGGGWRPGFPEAELPNLCLLSGPSLRLSVSNFPSREDTSLWVGIPSTVASSELMRLQKPCSRMRPGSQTAGWRRLPFGGQFPGGCPQGRLGTESSSAWRGSSWLLVQAGPPCSHHLGLLQGGGPPGTAGLLAGSCQPPGLGPRQKTGHSWPGLCE